MCAVVTKLTFALFLNPTMKRIITTYINVGYVENLFHKSVSIKFCARNHSYNSRHPKRRRNVGCRVVWLALLRHLITYK